MGTLGLLVSLVGSGSSSWGLGVDRVVAWRNPPLGETQLGKWCGPPLTPAVQVQWVLASLHYPIGLLYLPVQRLLECPEYLHLEAGFLALMVLLLVVD